MKKRKAKPEFIGWGITKTCNLRCIHCYSEGGIKASSELTTQESFKVIDQLIPLGVKVVGLTGGEPLLRKDLEEIMFYGKNKGLFYGITTNGILMHKKRVQSLKKAGMGFVQVSLDGSTAERNKRIRRATKDEFDKAVASIRYCQEEKVPVSLSMLISSYNLDDVSDYIEFAKKNNVEGIRFCGYVPLGRGEKEEIKKKMIFKKEDLKILKKFIEINLNNENPILLYDPGFGPLPTDYKFHKCIAGIYTFYISFDGNVYPCTSLLSKEFIVGNVKEKSLEEIWNDQRMTQIAKMNRSKLKGKCVNCQYLAGCYGACRGITFAYTHNLYSSFPVCLSRV